MLDPADTLFPADLRIVPIAAVLPHEVADTRREQRIEQRLQRDGVLRDPVMVGSIPELDRFILLDGTNRRLALQQLGYPLILVQVLNYADHHAVGLRTWCHAVELPLDRILAGAYAIPGVEIRPLVPLGAADALHDQATLALLLDRARHYVLSRLPGSAVPRAEQLRSLVSAYEPHMVREDCNPDEIEAQAAAVPPDVSRSLVAFPPITRGQVVQMALEGALIPAGITRHVIRSGRALRVNIPLEMLAGQPEQATVALAHHLEALHPRIYREPTILFDS